MTRLLVLVLALFVATLGCDAEDEHAHHDQHAAHVHRDLPGGELADLSISTSAHPHPLQSQLRGVPICRFGTSKEAKSAGATH